MNAEGGFVEPGWWLACEEPERPLDALVWWHYQGCLACQIKAEASMYSTVDLITPPNAVDLTQSGR